MHRANPYSPTRTLHIYCPSLRHLLTFLGIVPRFFGMHLPAIAPRHGIHSLASSACMRCRIVMNVESDIHILHGKTKLWVTDQALRLLYFRCNIYPMCNISSVVYQAFLSRLHWVSLGILPTCSSRTTI